MSTRIAAWATVRLPSPPRREHRAQPHPLYVQFAAATRDGRRAVTTSLNIPAPEGDLLAQLRAMQETAVCLLLRN